MNEAEKTGSTAPETPEMVRPMRTEDDHALEVAIYDLVGAASAASVILEATREDENLATGQTFKEAIAWLENRLSAGAENLASLYEGREPRWLTMNGEARLLAAFMRTAEREEKAGA